VSRNVNASKERKRRERTSKRTKGNREVMISSPVRGNGPLRLALTVSRLDKNWSRTAIKLSCLEGATAVMNKREIRAIKSWSKNEYRVEKLIELDVLLS
jgi:hypothetical protein